jgi:hypothetical protein
VPQQDHGRGLQSVRAGGKAGNGRFIGNFGPVSFVMSRARAYLSSLRRYLVWVRVADFLSIWSCSG